MKLSDYLKKINLYDQVVNGVKKYFGHNTDLFCMTVARIEDCEFKIMNRSKQIAGTCLGTSLIRLHEKVAERPVDRNKTMLHEIGHLIRNCERNFYGEGDSGVTFRYVQKGPFTGLKMTRKRRSPHGKEWKSIVTAIGGTPKTCHNYSYLKGNPSEYKHKYTCQDCGYEHFTNRLLKNMDRRYHSGCKRKPHGGHFTYTQLR